MCCLLAILVLIGPRAAILVWWLVDQIRWAAAFDSFIWPLLGFLFLPWTTLVWVLVFPGGIDGFDWLWLAIGVAIDAMSWAGGAANRSRATTVYRY